MKNVSLSEQFDAHMENKERHQFAKQVDKEARDAERQNVIALVAAVRAVRERHTAKAKRANFDDCGCNDCLTLGPALALADNDS